MSNSDSISSGKNIFDKFSGMDKKMANIPSDFIKERINCTISANVTDSACDMFSDHYSEKLTKIIKSGICYMNHCGRTEFTIEDFNKGIQPIEKKFLGYGGKFSQFGSRSTDEQREKKSPVLEVSSNWFNDENPYESDLTDEEENYFNEMTKVLLTGSEAKCYVIMEDLKTNNCIFRLVPHFVYFLSEYLFECDDFVTVSLLLNAMNSLFYNPNLYFDNNLLHKLSSTLLKFLYNDLEPCEKDYCYVLKDSAADLLVKILKKSNSKKIVFDTLDKLEGVFMYVMESNSFVYHYGVMAAINAIGVPAIFILILPYFNKYCEYIYQYISDSTTLSMHEINEILRLHDKIMHSHYLLMHYFFKHEFHDRNLKRITGFPEFSKEKIFPAINQINFNEYFDDCLVNHFPLLDFVSYNVNLKQKNANSRRKISKCKVFSPLKHNNGEKSTKKCIHKIGEIFNLVPVKKHMIKFSKIKMTI